MRSAPLRITAVLLCAWAAACASAPVPAADPFATRVGPPRGVLFIAGGGALDAELVTRFVELAGGPAARIVIIPTAGVEDSFPPTWPGFSMFRAAGARQLTILHTRSREEADSERFVEPLRHATAVWLPGGRQWRLADAYLDTRTQRELLALLERGGVIGGTSAGASIQASYMVRGAVESNTVVMAPGRETGFGLLRDVAVDQHLTARERQDDLLQVVERHPALLGIGIDESTALIVTGDRADVVGQGRVAFYNAADRGDLPYYFLTAGSVFDLAARRTVQGSRITPQSVRDEAAVIAAMTRLFDAMRTRDTTTIRRLMHPELRIFVPVRDGSTPALRVATPDQFIASIALAEQRMDERAIRPEVRVDGDLAIVWTRYDFLIGPNFSHCGTDAFHYARTSDGWTIIGLAYTVQREGCHP